MPLAPLIEMPSPGIPLSPCFADRDWGVPTQVRVADFATTSTGTVYFLERDEVTGFRDLRVRRIGATSGSVMDPGFDVLLSVEPGQTQGVQAHIRAAADFVYLAGTFSRVNGQPATGLVRLRSDTGQLDNSWPALPVSTTIVQAELDATYAYMVGLRLTGASPGSAFVSSGNVIRRAVADGSLVRSVEATAFNRPMGAAPWMSITSFGDGRLLAVGSFRVMDGQPRDGFAIVGSVETILADGFEANP